jgi:hypothetical protein
MENMYRFIKILLSLCIAIVLHSCNEREQIFIVIGEKASTTEILTANHLKKDLESVSGKTVSVIDDSKTIPPAATIFIVGTPLSNGIIGKLIKSKLPVLTEDFPGNRGGIWAKVKLEDGMESIVLAGSDVQGTQYAIYDYCQKVLGIDPFEYWTGKLPDTGKPFNPFNFSDKIIPPPEIPILCYFENDVDELANLKTPLLEYDWESYTQMINSLVRLKYNAIHLFDMLGRPEFFQRVEYQKIRPDYDVRLSYIDSLIDYAHDMGMKVEIDLSLGYKIKPMAQERADCWKNNKDEWIATWKYYFEETPIRKADIFSLRPRNQVWDWEYKSSCGEDKTEVFNEVYKVLGDIIDSYNPDALKVATCYADGMEMFNNDFAPPNDWIIAWSDDGWGGFASLPESTKGYSFGTYMHAGFWKNHTIHDPYPEKIDTVMKMVVSKFQANKYWEINGQQFRPFLINIEAFAAAASNPEAFNGEAFYKEWTERYFGEQAAVFAVRSMKKLHEAQFDKISYVQHLSEIKQVIGYLGNISISRPGTPPVMANYERIESNFQHVEKRFEILKQALAEAERGQEFVDIGNTFYHDYILLPVNLYIDLLSFEITLNKMALLKKTFEETGDKTSLEEALKLLEKAGSELNIVYKRSLEGDKNERWAGWYDPVKRRPNNGFPTLEMLNKIGSDLKSEISVANK